MSIQITQIRKEEKETFLNLYNLYLYDLSEYNGDEPKEDGRFDATNTYLYLERDELHPFFIRKNEKIIGFILICSPPFVPEKVDFAIQELFVLKKHRRNNTAAQAIELVLKRLKGNLRVEQLRINKPAVNFWNKFYKSHNISYMEKEEIIEVEGLEGLHNIILQDFKIEEDKLE